MKQKGVCYDVGRVLEGHLTRPVFDLKVVQRELEIIRNDLHCNAVRIQSENIDRLVLASECALKLGLEVYFSPEMFEKSQQETFQYLSRAAVPAEELRRRWPGQLTFSVGSELTLFMQGIVAGRTLMQRLSNPFVWENIKAGKHNAPLNAFLARSNEAIRKLFHGQVTYAALPWEAVDWSLFDVISLDHYWDERIRDRYVDVLRPLIAHRKPVFIAEFGFCAYRGAEKAGGRAWDIVDYTSMSLHSLPLVGRFVRPRLNGAYVRDEALQARLLSGQLAVLDAAGVAGAFVFTFSAPLFSHNENPRYDMDMASYSLVKSYADNHGATYADMPWEPKEAFHAIAGYYASKPTA